jgi:hypothetical protein
MSAYQTLATPATKDANFGIICRPWFTKENIQELKAKLGTDFATEACQLHLHPGLTSMEMVRHSFRREMS